MDNYVCQHCDYVYEPELGEPDRGIEPGTPFESLPEDWKCPICGASKSDFYKQ
ncbi:MAG: rubredoxin [Desulfobulbaceae bacterium]|nr:rubredoxin [Desulfobulbaceae bacterium]